MDKIQKLELIGKLKKSIILSEEEKLYFANHIHLLTDKEIKELKHLLAGEQKIDWGKEKKIIEMVTPKVEELKKILRSD